MSICVECGEFELYYVPACGDPAVGESNVLLFAGNELTALKAEIREMDEAFGNLDQAKAAGEPEAVVNAQDHLAKLLKSYIKPTANLPDKHLVQAYAINGKRWTRIRSDRMRNHWRSYKIDKSLLETTRGSDGKSSLNRAELAQAFKAVGNKIKADLAKGISYSGTAQVAKGQVSGSITDVWDANWLKWVDAVNESLTYSTGNANFDLSAGAQLLRGYAGFGVQLGYDPKKGNYALKGNAEARAILGEAKATFTGYFIDKDGWHALIEFGDAGASEAGTQGQLDFGYFRFSAEISASAMLGASIYGTAGLEFATEPTGMVRVKPSAADSKGEIAAGAFAGVEAGGSVKGNFEWMNPGWRDAAGASEPASWKALVSVGVTGFVSAGAGAEATLKITYEGGRFMFRCEARAVLGVGAKGGITGVVDFRYIIELITYIYVQLRDNDFAFLYFVSEAAYQALVRISLIVIEYGQAALDGTIEGISNLMESVTSALTGAKAAREYADKIVARPNALIFASPEAKGAVLYKLSERFTFDLSSPYILSFEERQEYAILTVISTIQSQREWAQVVERITPTGAKTTAAAGLARLRAIMDGGARNSFETMIRAIGSFPESTTRLAGTPITVRNLA